MTTSVSPAAAHELLPALRWLFPDDDVDRTRDQLASGAHDPTGLLVARDTRGRVRGAGLVQALPGALGVAWPVRAASAELGDALAAAACHWLIARGVKVCQAFVRDDGSSAMSPLERAGFRRVTELVSMARALSPDDAKESPGVLAFSTETAPMSDAFREVLLATHTGTLDAPELNGTRTDDELVAGFAEPPVAAWHLARRGGEPVGVVMTAPGADEDAVELSYLGVVPAARGFRFGDQLVRKAFDEAGRTGRLTVTLSVDARNEPALRLYRRHGFVVTDRREAWLAQFGGCDA